MPEVHVPVCPKNKRHSLSAEWFNGWKKGERMAVWFVLGLHSERREYELRRILSVGILNVGFEITFTSYHD